MALSDQIEEFRVIVKKIVEQLEEIDADSARIPSIEVSELGRSLGTLSENLSDANRKLDSAMEDLEDIRSQWG